MSNPGFWNQRAVLVTGATGFLGGWLVERLVREGARVICLVRDWTPELASERNGPLTQCVLVHGEVQDRALLERTLSDYAIETVFHLAAQALVGVALQDPVSTFETNIAGTWSLLEAARRVGRPQVVVASSDKAYGAQPVLPYTEDMPLQGRHPYDVSKSCADLLARCYAESFELPVVITRCGNLYGGGDRNWSRLIPGTMRAVLRGERPVIRSDGSLIRDYLYVEDAVDGYLRFAEALAQRPELQGEALNLSTGIPATVLEVVERILSLAGSELTPEILNQASHEIPAQHLSAARALKLLGWQARVGLDEGLTRTLAWYREFLHE